MPQRDGRKNPRRTLCSFEPIYLNYNSAGSGNYQPRRAAGERPDTTPCSGFRLQDFDNERINMLARYGGRNDMAAGEI